MTTEIKNLKFKDAYEELEGISRALQKDSDDLDELIKKVRRAAELIKYCKSALTTAESEIGQIIREVEETTEKDSTTVASTIETNNETSSKDEDLPF